MAPRGSAGRSSVETETEPSATTSCTPMTISCLTEQQGSRRVKYYHALQLERPVAPDVVLKHKVLLGELVVYETPDGTKLESVTGLAQVGRVVALYESKESVTMTTDYSLDVRPLFAWDQVRPAKVRKGSAPQLSNEDAKKIKENVRVKNALFESAQTETISCQRVLLGRTIRLLPPGDAATEADVKAEQFVLLDIPSRQKRPKKDKTIDSWVLKYTCRHRIDQDGSIREIDDIDYEAVATDGTVPALIKREMSHIADRKLEKAILDGYCTLLKEHIMVEERCSASFVGVEPKNSDTLSGGASASDGDHMPSKGFGVKRKASKEALLVTDKKASKRRGRNMATVEIVDTVTARAASMKTIGRNQPSEYEADATGRDRQPSAPKTVVLPLSESVYTLTGVARGDPCKPSIHFYTHVQLSVDRQALDASLLPDCKDEAFWTIAVGDVIAASSGKSGNRKHRWFPFTRPWSPAQVLSIYKVGLDSDSNSAAGNLMMELRWFYRPDDLDPELEASLPAAVHQKLYGDTAEVGRMIIEVDEHVNEVPIELALGRVIPSSDSVVEGRERYLADDGVPQIRLIIQFKYFMQLDDRILHETTEWNDYTKTFHGPLNAVLTCYRGWPGRKECKGLRKSYKTFLMNRYSLHDSMQEPNTAGEAMFVDAIHGETVHTKAFKEWPRSMVESGKVSFMTKNARVLHTEDPDRGKSREYLSSINIPVLKKCCDPRVTASKASSSQQYWNIQIGDFICFMDNEALPDLESVSIGRNPWYPFLGPWSVGQLLCMYHQRSRNATISGPLLEIRKFLRKSDIPSHLYSRMPPRTDFDRDYCFETNVLLTDIPVSRVLGRADLFLGRFAEAAKTRQTLDSGVPSRSCRCCFSYDASLGRFQPLFSASKTPTGWLSMMTYRGVLASNLMQQRVELKEKVMDYLRPSSNIFDLDPMLAEHECDDLPLVPLTLRAKKPGVSYYLAAPVNPRWDYYANSEFICPSSDRPRLAWHARVGDIVAVRARDEPNSSQELLPFTVPWEIGQILSIYRPTEGHILVELRWLRRNPSGPEIGSMDFVSESETTETDVVPLLDLVGPIMVLGNSAPHSEWSTIYPFLPVIPVVYAGSSESSSNDEPSKYRHPFNKIIRRGLKLSAQYSEDDINAILSELDNLAADEETDRESLASPVRSSYRHLEALNRNLAKSPASDISSPMVASAKVSGPSFYMDKASGIECFEALTAMVPQSVVLHDAWYESGVTWEAKVGDVVILQYDVRRKVKVSHCEPFNVPWGIGEVVTIFRRIDADAEDIRLEIRWFYRFEDIPGRTNRDIERCDSVLDEVFETDDYEDVSASRLLAPAKLIESPTVQDRTALRSRFLFICRRFWSVKNKSVVPTGGLSGRIQRGRRFSKYFSRLHAQSQHSRKDNVETADLDDGPQRVLRAFRRVIEKMSLTDASKVAINDEDGLVGRQKEREIIAKFLRNAIIGRINDKRPSIFIAGPPGVGKTACVRAVVGDLQKEQAAGKVPPFEFFVVNGMEMRHPLELYALLWELLTGDRVAVEAKTAHQRLDNFFGRLGGDASTIVLLVDEIDYLVTRDQSVIYSLFDWPARSAEISCPRRLILIGISNTLNLPEQMHPRVQSRLGSHRCPFRAYGVAEAAEILHAKVKQASPHYEVFTPDCISYAAKKTASMSGDIRKALTLCRIAAEAVLEEIENGTVVEEKPQVILKQMFKVTGSSFNSPESHRIAGLSDFEALMIIALASLTRSTGREQGGFDVEEIMTKMDAMANALGDVRYVPTPCLSETLEIVSRLGASQLVSLYTPRNASISYRAAMAGSGGAWPLVALLVDDNLLYMALKDTRHSALVNAHLKR